MVKESISLTLDEEVIEKAKKKAEKEERSVSYVVNEILKKNLKGGVK